MRYVLQNFGHLLQLVVSEAAGGSHDEAVQWRLRAFKWGYQPRVATPGSGSCHLCGDRNGTEHQEHRGQSVSQAQSSQPGLTIASAVDREISGVEKQVLDAAETMPEDKFNFSPESLSIPGDDYKGVRTFAVQVKHIAAPNYYLWSGLPGIAAGQPQGRERSGGREEQGRDPDVPAGFICAGSQGRSHVDNGEYVAGPGAQQIDAPAPGNLCRRPRF